MTADLEKRIDTLERQAAEAELLGRLSHDAKIRKQSKLLADQLRKLIAELKNNGAQ